MMVIVMMMVMIVVVIPAATLAGVGFRALAQRALEIGFHEYVRIVSDRAFAQRQARSRALSAGTLAHRAHDHQIDPVGHEFRSPLAAPVGNRGESSVPADGLGLRIHREYGDTGGFSVMRGKESVGIDGKSDFLDHVLSICPQSPSDVNLPVALGS